MKRKLSIEVSDRGEGILRRLSYALCVVVVRLFFVQFLGPSQAQSQGESRVKVETVPRVDEKC